MSLLVRENIETFSFMWNGFNIEVEGVHVPPVKGCDTMRDGSPGWPGSGEDFEILEARVVGTCDLLAFLGSRRVVFHDVSLDADGKAREKLVEAEDDLRDEVLRRRALS